jgi:hypothetical protein
MKDTKGHGSNPRGAHAEGIDKIGRGDSAPVAYHGTTQAFDKFSDPNDSNQWQMMDRRLGTHFAADPEVSNSFLVKPNTAYGGWDQPKEYSPEGSRIMQVALPPKSKFLDAGQKKYDSGSLQSDQDAIEKMIGMSAFKQDPEMLGRFISRSRNMPAEDGQKAARDMLAGKAVKLPNGSDTPMTLERFVDNFGAHSFDVNDQKHMVDLARQDFKKQGYVGVKYTDTSPMEMEHAKDPTSYILFDGNDAKPRYGK